VTQYHCLHEEVGVHSLTGLCMSALLLRGQVLPPAVLHTCVLLVHHGSSSSARACTGGLSGHMQCHYTTLSPWMVSKIAVCRTRFGTGFVAGFVVWSMDVSDATTSVVGVSQTGAVVWSTDISDSRTCGAGVSETRAVMWNMDISDSTTSGVGVSEIGAETWKRVASHEFLRMGNSGTGDRVNETGATVCK
jgi:hypothetical protein